MCAHLFPRPALVARCRSRSALHPPLHRFGLFPLARRPPAPLRRGHGRGAADAVRGAERPEPRAEVDRRPKGNEVPIRCANVRQLLRRPCVQRSCLIPSQVWIASATSAAGAALAQRGRAKRGAHLHFSAPLPAYRSARPTAALGACPAAAPGTAPPWRRRRRRRRGRARMGTRMAGAAARAEAGPQPPQRPAHRDCAALARLWKRRRWRLPLHAVGACPRQCLGALLTDTVRTRPKTAH